jgi:hypothetical protein
MPIITNSNRRIWNERMSVLDSRSEGSKKEKVA